MYKTKKVSSKDSEYKKELFKLLENNLNNGKNIYYLYLSNLDWFNHDDDLLKEFIIFKSEYKTKNRIICKFIAKITSGQGIELVTELWNGGCDKTEFIVISDRELNLYLNMYCCEKKQVPFFDFEDLKLMSDILIYNEESDDYNSFVYSYDNNNQEKT